MGDPIYTIANTNMTTSNDADHGHSLAPGMQTLYDRRLLEIMEPELVHLQFGVEYKQGKGNGKVRNVRKLLPIATNTRTLTEGNTPDPILLGEMEVVMTMDQYGDWTRTTDLLDMTHMDLNISNKVELFGDAGARSIDAVVRDQLALSDNVIWANGKTARSQLTANDKLTTRELRRAVRNLKKKHARKFAGYYVAIVGPDTTFDLQDDPNWVAVAQYQAKEAIFTGEIGRLFGVRFVESTEAKIFEGAGAQGANVASVVVMGQDAYATISIDSNKPHVIVKPHGSAGTEDPLEQRATIGWKMDCFGAKLLQPDYLVRIECGYSA